MLKHPIKLIKGLRLSLKKNPKRGARCDAIVLKPFGTHGAKPGSVELIAIDCAMYPLILVVIFDLHIFCLRTRKPNVREYHPVVSDQ